MKRFIFKEVKGQIIKKIMRYEAMKKLLQGRILTCAIVRSDSGLMEVLLRSRATRVDFCSVNNFLKFLSDSNADESSTAPTGHPRYGSNSNAMWQPASERRQRRGVQPVSRLNVRSER